MFSSIVAFSGAYNKRTLMAITCRRTAFAGNKVTLIVALGLLYMLNMVTNFSIFLQVVGFLTVSHKWCSIQAFKNMLLT